VYNLTVQYNYFVPSRYEEFVHKCLHLFQTGEPAIFLFAPKSDRVRRTDQIIQQFQDTRTIIKVRLIAEDTEDIEDLEMLIKKQLNGDTKKLIGIFILNAEQALEEKNYALLENIVTLQEDNSRYRFILCFERDVTDRLIAKNFCQTSFFSNVNYYSLYDQKDAYAFIKYLENKWNLNIKGEVKEKIVDNCGGHTWLLKETMRILRDEPKAHLDKAFVSEAMNVRLEQIYHGCSEIEQKVIRAIVEGKSIIGELEKHSFNYLKKIGLVTGDKLSILLLENYIRQYLPKIFMVINDNKIVLNDVNVDSNFSKKEKHALKILLNRKGFIITRDEMSKAIWPINTEDQYSDWAIDRIIARLRNKLQELGLPKTTIQTLRNRGYLLIN